MPHGKLGKALRTARKKLETKTRVDEKKTKLAIEEQIAEFLETHGGLQLGQHHCRSKDAASTHILVQRCIKFHHVGYCPICGILVSFEDGCDMHLVKKLDLLFKEPPKSLRMESQAKGLLGPRKIDGQTMIQQQRAEQARQEAAAQRAREEEEAQQVAAAAAEPEGERNDAAVEGPEDIAPDAAGERPGNDGMNVDGLTQELQQAVDIAGSAEPMPQVALRVEVVTQPEATAIPLDPKKTRREALNVPKGGWQAERKANRVKNLQPIEDKKTRKKQTTVAA